MASLYRQRLDALGGLKFGQTIEDQDNTGLTVGSPYLPTKSGVFTAPTTPVVSAPVVPDLPDTSYQNDVPQQAQAAKADDSVIQWANKNFGSTPYQGGAASAPNYIYGGVGPSSDGPVLSKNVVNGPNIQSDIPQDQPTTPIVSNGPDANQEARLSAAIDNPNGEPVVMPAPDATNLPQRAPQTPPAAPEPTTLVGMPSVAGTPADATTGAQNGFGDTSGTHPAIQATDSTYLNVTNNTNDPKEKAGYASDASQVQSILEEAQQRADKADQLVPKWKVDVNEGTWHDPALAQGLIGLGLALVDGRGATDSYKQGMDFYHKARTQEEIRNNKDYLNQFYSADSIQNAYDAGDMSQFKQKKLTAAQVELKAQVERWKADKQKAIDAATKTNADLLKEAAKTHVVKPGDQLVSGTGGVLAENTNAKPGKAGVGGSTGYYNNMQVKLGETKKSGTALMQQITYPDGTSEWVNTDAISANKGPANNPQVEGAAGQVTNLTNARNAIMSDPLFEDFNAGSSNKTTRTIKNLFSDKYAPIQSKFDTYNASLKNLGNVQLYLEAGQKRIFEKEMENAGNIGRPLQAGIDNRNAMVYNDRMASKWNAAAQFYRVNHRIPREDEYVVDADGMYHTAVEGRKGALSTNGQQPTQNNTTTGNEQYWNGTSK